MCIPHNRSTWTDTRVMIFFPSLTTWLWLWEVFESLEQSHQLDIGLRGEPAPASHFCPPCWCCWWCTVWCMLMQTVLCFGFAYPCPSRNFNPGLMNEKLVRYWYGVDLTFISIFVKRTLHGVPVLWRVSSRDPGLPHHQKRAHQVNILVSALDQGTGLCWLCITPPRCWEPLSPHGILYAID